jgi:hypothetical protein
VSWKDFGVKDTQQLFTRLLSTQPGPLSSDSQHASTFLIEEKDDQGRAAARAMPGVVVAGAGSGSGAGSAVEEGDYVDL